MSRTLVSYSTEITLTNRSGSIAAGGVAQQLMPANANRRGMWVQNVSSGDLWVYELGTATQSQPSYKLVAGASMRTPDSVAITNAWSIIGATTGQQFSAREY